MDTVVIDDVPDDVLKIQSDRATAARQSLEDHLREGLIDLAAPRLMRGPR